MLLVIGVVGVFAGCLLGLLSTYKIQGFSEKKRAIFDYYDELGLVVEFLEKRLNGTYEVHFVDDKQSVVRLKKDDATKKYTVDEKVEPFNLKEMK